MNSHKEVKVLIAEDDRGHAELIIEALYDSGLRNEIVRFEDGKDLWDYLLSIIHEPANAASTYSYLILLDINMPRMDGTEVLEKIKCTKELKDIPVIMLTTTDDPREIERCYQLGCNVYITKPVDFIKFTDTLQRIGLFLQIISV
jgi:CheY-like chemotaxis protein